MYWLPFVALGATAVAQEAPADSPLYSMEMETLQGAPFAGKDLKGEVVLFVNVASKCGYTPQYEGLQALYDEHKDAGLRIVGVPCNQFMGQEPGSADQIAEFCSSTYGVKFPLLNKQKVNGSDRSDLYKWLVGSPAGAGKNIRWNFEKFLVGRDGKVIARYGSSVAPESEELRSAIARALGNS